MYRRAKFTLGSALLLCLFAFAGLGLSTLFSMNLLIHGVAAQGIITATASINCNKHAAATFSVQFSDQRGQSHTSIIDQCEYPAFNASPGDSVNIVYLPDDPGQIAPPDELRVNARGGLFVTILLGLVSLLLLFFWVGRRIQQAKEPESLKQPQSATVAPSEYTGNSLFHD